MLLSLLGVLVLPPAQAGSDTLMINVIAEVVNQACSLRPGDETITINFGNIVNKELLRDQRTPGKEFQLHLEECDLDISKSVKVTFSGQGAPEDPDLLALMEIVPPKELPSDWSSKGAYCHSTKPAEH